MSNKYKFTDAKGIYFISYSTINWIDVFIRNEYREILLDSWKYCMANKGLKIHGWCIMTSHVHLIISSGNGKPEEIIRDTKRHTSTMLKNAIRENPAESRKEWIIWMMERAGKKNGNNIDWQFWQQDNHPIEIFSYEVAKQKLDYIHNNPVEAGFVSRPQDYAFSSARDYMGEVGVFEGLELLI